MGVQPHTMTDPPPSSGAPREPTVDALSGFLEVEKNERAQLDMRVRQQQMEWLQKNSQRDELDHLNRRVESMVRRSHAREVYKAAAETRRETIHFAVFAALFTVVLSNFIIHESFEFAAKLRERALGPGDRWLDDILTADDTWDYIADRLVPRVFSDHASSSWPTSDFKNTMLGAVQLQPLQASFQANPGRADELEVAFMAGVSQRQVAARTRTIRVGASSKQHRGRVGVAMLAGHK